MENQMSEVDFIWYTNLNRDPFLSNLLLIVSYIVDRMVKNYSWLIWGYRSKLRRQ